MEQNILHYRIAERGKMHALDKNYKEALRHYKEALKLTQKQQDSELFFQHYSQCVMESLELSGAYDEVISFCENYRSFLKEKEQDVLVRKHNAFVSERQAIQHILKGEQEEAKDLLQEIQKDLGRGKQPITDQLLGWLLRGYKINADQLKQLQQKHNYFIVRKESVNPKIAMDLPEGISPF
ncbi:peptidylprolyl isomerase [Tenacibaculum sp. M341]|uniref:peptidylprolyl isomerase n=1 Tax=Tenacibaculum sp. M341 TaxID=2530339 RepID=UPI001045E257|nr:peptidylprolyl isomerase [Tenacibaculum sp. M341]TCI94285.1 peptidylprolyl isomerase [Tenacibaculum sp. M341]